MVVYKITHLDTERCYIGQCIGDVKARWRSHKASDTHLGRAIKKYGVESFSFEIIDTADSIAELNEKEIKYIAKYSSIMPNGFNIESGGRNAPMAEHVKAIISQTHKGKTIPDWQRKLISEVNKNKIVSAETREKIRQSRIGKKLTDEAKKKIAEANKFKTFVPRTPESKEHITQLNLVRSKNNSAGVSFSKRDNAYIGRVVYKGKDIKKSFSISKHGENAYSLAKEFRDRLLDSLIKEEYAV